jgi:ABC-2 type transport system permease protein
MVLAQGGLELRLALRNGEQLLLTLVIPLLVLVIGTESHGFDVGTDDRVGFLTPGVLALAVLSTAFTSLAIATGFERRYGALKRLGATPLPRSGLLAGKTLGVVAVELVQIALIVGVALALDWDPHGSAVAVAGVLALGTVTFCALGLLLAGTLRAEATLALANLVYLLLLAASGVATPLERMPDGLRHVLELLPSTALVDALRTVLFEGGALPGEDVLTLAVWAVVAVAAAARWFRWE